MGCLKDKEELLKAKTPRELTSKHYLRAMAAIKEAEGLRGASEKAYIAGLRTALKHARKAAYVLRDVPSAEPLRSHLFQEAAWLAYNTRQFRVAERLCAEGLAGDPLDPKRLREILKMVWSRSYPIRDATKKELYRRRLELGLWRRIVPPTANITPDTRKEDEDGE